MIEEWKRSKIADGRKKNKNRHREIDYLNRQMLNGKENKEMHKKISKVMGIGIIAIVKFFDLNNWQTST